MEQTKSDLHTEWEMTDLGEPTKIIGVKITQTEDSITFLQKVYVESILEREGLSEINSVATPLDPNIKLVPNPDGNEGNRSNSFTRLLGELQFLANSTRPDIAFAMNRLAAYTANPSLQHVMALKRILWYLAGTKNLGITYSKTADNPDKNIFHRFANAAFANHDDHKSTSGYIFLAAGGAITWKSKKQMTIALSSTQAEYVALSEAARKACWLRSLFDELGYPQEHPTLIKGDNDSLISMAKNQQFHNRSKHIAIRWHWVRELIKGVPGSECQTGGRLVGCRWSLEKKKKNFINFWPDRALLSTNVNYISSIYYIELKSTEIHKKNSENCLHVQYMLPI